METNIDTIEKLVAEGRNIVETFNVAIEYINFQLEVYNNSKDDSVKQKIQNALFLAGCICDFVKKDLKMYHSDLVYGGNDDKAIDETIISNNNNMKTKFFQPYKDISKEVEEKVGITLDPKVFQNITLDYATVLETYFQFKSNPSPLFLQTNIDTIEELVKTAKDIKQLDAFNVAIQYINSQLEVYNNKDDSVKQDIKNTLLIVGLINQHCKLRLNDYQFAIMNEREEIINTEIEANTTQQFFQPYEIISKKVEEKVGIILDPKVFQNITLDYATVLETYFKFKSTIN
jgi:hypothetical protein